MKLNCWEFKKCGREINGTHELEFGVCPAHEEKRLHGIHGGTNAGRACWSVAGTMCGGKVQGTYAEKEKNCMICDFYKSVQKDEFGSFRMIMELRKMLSQN
ncbi:MAG: two-CW domain-containing protein [Nitrospirota bacterium]